MLIITIKYRDRKRRVITIPEITTVMVLSLVPHYGSPLIRAYVAYASSQCVTEQTLEGENSTQDHGAFVKADVHFLDDFDLEYWNDDYCKEVLFFLWQLKYHQ
ncbi:hypothetical protein TNCT_367001 [Trichonephila clavata]|uniref:Uncharacterized protein n=1 Tax=Trichonephila clavata TaxID=2740835 RepID=A0A8X6IN10_TRICU|nr:hypothetical protein TNCT_367001 [Trichonephila clavata]